MTPLRLFEGYGVELEYMIVRDADLSVAPLADEILKSVAGEYASEVEIGTLAWCNELVLHVIELKTAGPAPGLEGLAQAFQDHASRINGILDSWECRLLGSAMHPWMDPLRETRLWPHEYSPVYEAYDRIFGCRGHGWSNLQSLHMNLPFFGDEEFGRLHAAVRLLLPIVPALAAASPLVDGRPAGRMDHRLAVYRMNQQRIPSITGPVIPEPVFHPRDYREGILEGMYEDIAPFDPEGILRYEWLNSRAAIPRFDRGTIEIRIIDIQESPLADLAIYELIVATLKALVEERFSSYREQRRWEVAPLARILESTIADGGGARLEDTRYFEALGCNGRGGLTGRDLWRRILTKLSSEGSLIYGEALESMLAMPTLAERILSALGGDFSRRRQTEVYRRLSDCLAGGTLFRG
jgi:glutamate---cysteine ligase / carboxylate-amine ligase